MLAVASIAGTIFLHPMGMIITTVNDMGVNFYQICGALYQGETLEAAKQTMHLANHSFYLMIMLYGSLELQIASLAMQVLVEGASSVEEFKKGNWLEGTGHLLMTAIRADQLNGKVSALRQKWEIEEAIKSVFVGELHEKWQFPSDHLPVGIEINGNKILSWNVLNNKFMNWVTEKDSQGLNGSMITDLHIPVNEEGLTIRDQKIIEMLLSMTDTKTGMIALQECGMPFLNELSDHLPPDWKMIKSSDSPLNNQEVILYNNSKFSYNPSNSETVSNAFPCAPTKTLQNALFEPLDGTGKPIRLLNTHIPGNPDLPGREEFAQYVKENSLSSDATTIALGDHNFERDEMLDAYQKAGLFDFAFYSPWQTNIDPSTKKSKGIDHILVKGDTSSRNLNVEEILAPEYSLQETLDLLRGKIDF